MTSWMWQAPPGINRLVVQPTGGREAAVVPDNGSLLIEGNFKGYEKSPFKAWTGMWAHYLPQADQLQAESSMRVYPATFPDATTFIWDVTPDPDWTGVNGYLHIAWGNYDDSVPHAITPRQVTGIANLSVDATWSMTGDGVSGLLCELWLTSAATPSGSVPRAHEVAFFPKCSPSAISYLASLPSLGGYTDSNGVDWLVREGLSATDEPYLISYRPGYADHQGALPFHDFFAFLRGAGKIAGNEWVNGLAFGVEPHHGAGSLTINTLGVTYTAGAAPAPPSAPVNRIVNGGFIDETGWGGAWYSGKTIENGKAVFTASPPYDGFFQSGVTLVPGKYYELTWTVSGRTAGGAVFPALTGGTQRNGVVRSANGTFTERLLANAGNNQFEFMLETAGTLSVDDVSLVGPYDTATVGGT